jgi:hypothetical protein
MLLPNGEQQPLNRSGHSTRFGNPLAVIQQSSFYGRDRVATTSQDDGDERGVASRSRSDKEGS